MKKKSSKKLLILAAIVILTEVAALIISVSASAETDRFLEETDRFIEQAEQAAEKRQSRSYLPDWNREDEWNYINEPDQINSFYEGVHCITDETSLQFEWLQSHDWNFDEDGIGMYDGRIMVALTPAFGSIGDNVDLLLEDGNILQVVIVDEKADAEKYGHRQDGILNVIEILVSREWYDGEYDNRSYPNVIGYR